MGQQEQFNQKNNTWRWIPQEIYNLGLFHLLLVKATETYLKNRKELEYSRHSDGPLSPIMLKVVTKIIDKLELFTSYIFHVFLDILFCEIAFNSDFLSQ